MVRMKVYVAEKTPPSDDGTVYGITMYAVVDGSEENKKFFAATPSGSINLGTINPEAAAQFEPGKEYYVDFTPAE